MRALDFRQLRYFSILARELHFRKAADLAFVTQSALSQQITKLEETIGVPLFDRDRRKVELTPAGEVLRDELETMFAQLQRAVRLCREAAGAREFEISLGMVEYTNLPFVPPALVCLHAVYPDLKVARHEMHSVLQAEALQRRVIDIGFGAYLAPLPADAGVTSIPIMTAPWTLLMPPGHRLAGLKQLRIEDLASERLIIFERAVNPALYDGVVAHCRRAGFVPNFVYETNQSQVGMSMVARGLGVMLGAAYVFVEAPSSVVMRPIEDLAPLCVHMFTRTGENDPLMLEFMDMIVEEARATQVRLDLREADPPTP